MFIPHHVSHVSCQVSGVRCQVYFFLQSCGANRWRACYQQGLPCLDSWWVGEYICWFWEIFSIGNFRYLHPFCAIAHCLHFLDDYGLMMMIIMIFLLFLLFPLLLFLLSATASFLLFSANVSINMSTGPKLKHFLEGTLLAC